MLMIGHRGLPGETPENSLAGIRRAAELDLDGVEIDVRLGLDGLVTDQPRQGRAMLEEAAEA